jgi:hypothetical protein
VAYTVALLSRRFASDFGLDRIWRYQAVSDELAVVVTRLSRAVYGQIIDSADGRNVTEWCKKEDCWSAMQFLAAEIADDFPEVSLGGRSDASPASEPPSERKTAGRPATVDDVLAASRVMDVSAEIWQELARWGEATQILTAAQVRLAMQLHESAKAEWEKAPTAALTKRAVFLLDAAENHIDNLEGFHFTNQDWQAGKPSGGD